MNRLTQVDVVYEKLRGMVLEGTLSPGFDLNERAVAELVGTSRTPVREAVARLVDDGLAEREQRRTKVTAWDEESTGQLYEMRILLESEAARLAAMRRSPHATIRLKAALDTQRNLVNPSPAERRDSTYAFHNELWQACGNPFLLEANQKYGTQSLSIAPTSLRSDERWEASVAEHQELLTAVIEHRASDAAELMRGHLESAMHHL
ncbi:MAG TPA: GntR family transcriptional regulator [Candidatus Nesterenkonia stercoripullorum]|uniref:GntR family transcriptional regulator n=1 Tax=Candidatus Nesterenkonia stercoripullorum TaxID=2838701 RepID=A0A9D1UV67_9MICC|nr:GntR family transcriptional regulator [Candidatus Nesterenkonia stercoripullorum]